MDKELSIKLHGNRQVRGVLRGFDHFMNLVLDQAVEVVLDAEDPTDLGMVVIRGNSVVSFEPLEAI
jgi:small nuclear ribonucleoprotein G